MDAQQNGVFNIGPASGNASRTFHEDLEKDIFEFNYDAPVGTYIGVWTKGYPAELGPESADAVTISIFVPEARQLQEISVKVELKGARALQTVPLELAEGWNTFREPINWNLIGALSEVVFVVSPMGEGEQQVTGKLLFDLDFFKLSFIEKNFLLLKLGLVLLFGFIAAWLAGLLSRARGGARSLGAAAAGFSGLQRDLSYGIAVMMMAGTSAAIYSLGAQRALDGFDFSFLFVAAASALIADILKRGITGRHLTPLELFQNIVIGGLLAACSSPQVVLQAPATWLQVLAKSRATASVAFAIYHVFNWHALASSGRHARPISSALIVGTPYAFGWLLLLENPTLLQALGNVLTLGLLSQWPAVGETLGRAVVVLGFNELALNGISWATKSRFVQTAKAHLLMLFVSVAVVLSPWIANVGSLEALAALPLPVAALAAILTAMLSQAGLWGEVYLITGAILDGSRGVAPTRDIVSDHIFSGIRKGMAYSGILMLILYALKLLVAAPVSQSVMSAAPLWIGMAFGALVFPFAKTIIETFDGSQAFFVRARYSYRSWPLYARGAVAGYGLAAMITSDMFQRPTPERVLFGLTIGLIASSGISLLRDAFYTMKGRGKIQTWRLYLVDGFMGAFVGSGLAFYLDASQVPVVIERFRLYTSVGQTPQEYVTYPLVNKWGRIELGHYAGGVKLFFNEALAGVINWAVAAWLFAINRAFIEAIFTRDSSPIRFLFSKSGLVELMKHMIQVLRWGLWMSPIIFTFLRMMAEATWYNQDGLIRTFVAIYQSAALSPEAFQTWSLNVFITLLAVDAFRVLIWIDHMGLRVASLVNLSFIGMDKLDEKIAAFIGPAAAQRYIPEGVKRFTTWAPLLIPFYIPRGEDWDYAWSQSLAMQKEGGLIEAVQALPLAQQIALFAGGAVVFTAVSFALRAWHRRGERKRQAAFDLSNREYRVTLKDSGEMYSEVLQKEYDVTRRSYDFMDPCGRALYVVDADKALETSERAWPVLGNYPQDRFPASSFGKEGEALRVANANNGIITTLEVRLPDRDSAAEIWEITLENTGDAPRRLKLAPYLEWVLGRPLDDRFHTQYARLFPEMEYVSEANTLLAWQKNTKAMGVLAVEHPPEGFLASRVDFIGRARSLWSPRVVDTLDYLEPKDILPYPTFDPIGSMLIDATLGPKGKKTVRLLVGCASKREAALEMVARLLKPQGRKNPVSPTNGQITAPQIGHGVIPPGTPQPYSTYTSNGNSMIVRTPYTPRPYDHAMSNAAGHSVMVTNRGLHTSCNGNSQQNRVTPDWADMVTKEVPSEAIYLFDPDRGEWFSPTHHPLNEYSAKTESEFSVDGTAVFRMSKGTLSTELTVFVPTDDPLGVYLLTVKNSEDRSRRIRVAPYFQMVLGLQPERTGPLEVSEDKELRALYFVNPRNMFRTGTAFASLSVAPEVIETKRGRFFGTGRGTAHPYLVEQGEPDATQQSDERPVAAFLSTLVVPARGEVTVAIVLGQSDTRKEAIDLVRKYKNLKTVQESLKNTRRWWLSLMETAKVKTNSPDFDALQNWLKYQALAERIWARRGFYQTSGAYGFRDQLQDTVNLIWVDPALARKQVILHASQQFIEGDVFHWFFTLVDGRTAFAARSHASDNLLWLVWGVIEYVRMTGDETLLDEMTSYVVSELPFQPLPKNKHGWGGLYHRSTLADTIYRHCLKSINLVFDKRMGRNGLPLIGTGDWNDGLDEIGSEGKGESVWLGFFLYYILKDMVPIIGKREGKKREEYYRRKMDALAQALENTWRGDRYLRAIHDNGTEIGVKDSGVWEIDALTAAWAVMSGINQQRGEVVFNTALQVLERDNAVLLGWPALREDTKPYLGRSSKYPEGVRENGMYCHGVQWLIKAARILTERFAAQGNQAKADEYRKIAYRLWLKITPVGHVTPDQIEIYGGQPNKQPADILTTFDRGRMIWNGYTGAAGWLLRESFEGVAGATIENNRLILPDDLDKPRGDLRIERVERDVSKSPL